MIELLKQNEELWNLFTCKEEYNPLILDTYGRFPYYMSNYSNIFYPKLTEFLRKNSFNFKIDYPDNKEFAVCLTHDVDFIHLPKLGCITHIGNLLMKYDLKSALKSPLYHLNTKWNPMRNFKNIIKLEECFEAKSSFYFMGLEDGDPDFNYQINDLKEELHYIMDQGWEIGLHGGFKAFNNLEILKKEKRRLEKSLGKNVIGYRGHYLRFKVPLTWNLLREAGFKYDTTFGQPYCAGFKNGLCYPFKPFDLDRNGHIDIIEIPLNIMDNTVFGYMQCDFKGAYNIIKLLIDNTKKYNGIITILWHNNRLISDHEEKFYEKILKYCYEQNAWMCSGEEIYEFVKDFNF